MRVRHKVPSVFSLSMVDVLCCALGCVILIWLLNSKLSADEASDQEEIRQGLLAEAIANKKKSDELLASRRETADERDKAVAMVALLKDRIAKLEKEQADLLAALKKEKLEVIGLKGKATKAGEKAADLERELKAMLEKYNKEKTVTVKLSTDLASLLAKSKLTEKELKSALEMYSKEKATSGKLSAELATLVAKSKVSEKELKALLEKYDKEKAITVKLNADLALLLAKIKVTEKDLDKVKDREKDEKARAELLKKSVTVKERDLLILTKLLDEAKDISDKLRKSLDSRDLELAREKKGKLDLEKLLKLRNVALEDAGKTLKKLEAEKLVLKTAVDNRFAGIELTGQRVIFLVDMSGSMVLLDEKTDAPHKWREVRETVKKLMQSLAGLKQYQVITFSRDTSFPLGSSGKWITHDRVASPDRAYKALEAIKPVGGTNMYAALEQAFKYRSTGLDTIYLLSDGLPNLGEGLTSAEARKMPELEKGIILGKYVRQKIHKDWNRPLAGKPRVKIHTIGFFYESPDLGSFLWALARENDGSFVGMSKP
jgi:hypothetical protein